MNRPVTWIAIAAASAFVTHRALASLETVPLEVIAQGPQGEEEGNPGRSPRKGPSEPTPKVPRRVLDWADPAPGAQFDHDTGLPMRVIDRVHGFALVLIRPGEFVRGMRPEELASPYVRASQIAGRNEFPAHTVTLTRPYYLGETEVTQRQWVAVMGSRPFHHDAGDKYPAEEVHLEQVRELLTRTGYRLPTEAEWEYACRANEPAPLYSTDAPRLAVEGTAWTAENSGRQTKPVGTREPNGFGLYDMHGNVAEMCSDIFNEGSYIEALELGCVDPKGAERGHEWVVRGSHCRQGFEEARPSFRWHWGGGGRSDLGFRLARTP